MRMSPTVVGLDLSWTATGIAHPDGTTETVGVPAGQLSQWARLVKLSDLIRSKTHRQMRPDLVVIEGGGFSTQRAHQMGELHGAVKTVIWPAARNLSIVPPATLKKFATGRGNVGKPQMAVALTKILSADEVSQMDDNQVDAWWLRAVGLHLLGAPVVSDTKDREAIVAKLKVER